MNTHIEYKGYRTMTLQGGKHKGWSARAYPMAGGVRVELLATDGYTGKGAKARAFAAIKALIDARQGA